MRRASHVEQQTEEHDGQEEIAGQSSRASRWTCEGHCDGRGSLHERRSWRLKEEREIARGREKRKEVVEFVAGVVGEARNEWLPERK